ncbi:Endonuclease/exonuclease/phosphatase, partial [Armillaria novae-zelandiae]
IGSLNISGRGGTNLKNFLDLRQIMRENNLAVVAIQESHLNDLLLMEVNTKLRGFQVVKGDMGNSTNTAGVAFMINNDILQQEGHTIKIKELIEGRALHVILPLKNGTQLELLNIYAPNVDTEMITFLENLILKMETSQELMNPTILGDFNWTENALDRYPMREEPNERVRALFNEIFARWNLIDGWRTTNSNVREFTHRHVNGNKTISASRLDKIYISRDNFIWSFEWKIQRTYISDHDMVMVTLVDEKLPYLGKGLWRLRPDTLKDKAFRARAKALLIEAQDSITTYKIRTKAMTEEQILYIRKERSIQHIILELKQKIQQIAKHVD